MADSKCLQNTDTFLQTTQEQLLDHNYMKLVQCGSIILQRFSKDESLSLKILYFFQHEYKKTNLIITYE